MRAQSSQACCDFVVAGLKNSTITGAAEVLRRIKTEASDHAHRARTASVVSRANRLRRIFDYGYSMTAAEVEQRIHRRALSVDVNGHDRFGSRRDRVRNA